MKRTVAKAILKLRKKVETAREAAKKAEESRKEKIIKAYKKAAVSYNETIDALVKAGFNPKKELVYSVLKEAGEEQIIKDINAYEELKKVEKIQALVVKPHKTKEELLMLLSKKNRELVLKAAKIGKREWDAWNKFKKGLLIDIKKFGDKAAKKKTEKESFDKETERIVSERAQERAESLLADLREGKSVNL